MGFFYLYYEYLVKKLNYLSIIFQACASYDMLTVLINRREFEVRLKKEIRAVKKNKVNYVLCYMELDEFKIVNDSCGHIAGDVFYKI